MKRNLIAIFVALGLCGFALYSWAQAPRHGGGDFVVVMQQVQAQLNLNSSQQQQWDNAVALSQTAHQTMRTNFSQLRTATQAELAKSAPDLGALATLSDEARQQGGAARLQARSAWLALYDNFTPDQKAVVRDAMVAKMQKMQARQAARQQQ